MAELKRDPLGVVYDRSWIGEDGETHYIRYAAKGAGGGPAQWSSAHDCNPICGCHLAAKCLGCGVCVNCDGCYCFEED